MLSSTPAHSGSAISLECSSERRNRPSLLVLYKVGSSAGWNFLTSAEHLKGRRTASAVRRKSWTASCSSRLSSSKLCASSDDSTTSADTSGNSSGYLASSSAW